MSKKQSGREPSAEPPRFEIRLTRAAERGLAALDMATCVESTRPYSVWLSHRIHPDQKNFREPMVSTVSG
jgi:hypothetical protein